MQAVVLSFGGIPLIYSGDEIGQLNDDSYANNPNKNYDNRWLHRPLFKKNQHSEEGSIYQSIQQLIHIRKQHDIFSDSQAVDVLNISDQIFAFHKKTNGQELICIYSFAEQEQSVTFYPSASSYWLNLISSQIIHGNQLTLLPYQFCWLVRTVNSGK